MPELDAQDWDAYAACHTGAVVSCALEDRLWRTESGRTRWLHGFGHYEETYEKHDRRWLVSSRRLLGTRVERG